MIHAFSNYIERYNIVKLFTRFIRLLFKIVYVQKKVIDRIDAPIKKNHFLSAISYTDLKKNIYKKVYNGLHRCTPSACPA